MPILPGTAKASGGPRVEASLGGIPEVMAQLEKLTGSQARKYIRQGAAAAAQVQIDGARAKLKANGSDRGRRTESFMARAKSGKRRGQFKRRRGIAVGLAKSFMKVPSSKWPNKSAMRATGKIGSRVGFRKSMGAHAHLVEHGHRMITANGKKVGTVPGYPFMRPIMDTKQDQFRAAFRDKIAGGIKKLMGSGK